MTVTYECGSGLYINITNKCTNSCDFCVRTSKDGYYGDLWLEREPSADEVIESVFVRDLSKYSEIVFCGYGEPFCRLNELVEIARAIKSRSSLPIRINTNGHADLINGRRVAPLLEGLIDTVSISLNAPDSQKYDAVCHSIFGRDAFDALIEFARNCKKYVACVQVSVVDVGLSEADMKNCKDIADSIGVELRIRKYIQ